MLQKITNESAKDILAKQIQTTKDMFQLAFAILEHPDAPQTEIIQALLAQKKAIKGALGEKFMVSLMEDAPTIRKYVVYFAHLQAQIFQEFPLQQLVGEAEFHETDDTEPVSSEQIHQFVAAITDDIQELTLKELKDALRTIALFTGEAIQLITTLTPSNHAPEDEKDEVMSGVYAVIGEAILKTTPQFRNRDEVEERCVQLAVIVAEYSSVIYQLIRAHILEIQKNPDAMKEFLAQF